MILFFLTPCQHPENPEILFLGMGLSLGEGDKKVSKEIRRSDRNEGGEKRG